MGNLILNVRVVYYYNVIIFILIISLCQSVIAIAREAMIAESKDSRNKFSDHPLKNNYRELESMHH